MSNIAFLRGIFKTFGDSSTRFAKMPKELFYVNSNNSNNNKYNNVRHYDHTRLDAAPKMPNGVDVEYTSHMYN